MSQIYSESFLFSKFLDNWNQPCNIQTDKSLNRTQGYDVFFLGENYYLPTCFTCIRIIFPYLMSHFNLMFRQLLIWFSVNLGWYCHCTLVVWTSGPNGIWNFGWKKTSGHPNSLRHKFTKHQKMDWNKTSDWSIIFPRFLKTLRAIDVILFINYWK